jgi:hypothetical protein
MILRGLFLLTVMVVLAAISAGGRRRVKKLIGNQQNI